MVARKRKNYSNVGGGRPPNKIPAFFKSFIPDTCTQRLKIPPAFSNSMQENLPDKAFLRDRYGNIWPVELAIIEDKTFFLEGWEKFVKDNSVELGDFLVFQFDGNHVFDVKLMGHTACEKKGVGSLIYKLKEEEQENNEIEEQEEKEESEEEEEEEEEEKIVDNYNTANEAEDDEENNEQEEMQVEQEAKFNKRVANSKHCRKSLKRIKGSIKVGHGDGAKAGKREFWREKRVDPYGFDIFRSGKISQPKNPYFVTKVRAKRRDELYVPVDIVRDHNLNLPPQITLRDPQGREWNTKLRYWMDGRRWYCGGWRGLCKINLVGENDTCICEFVTRNGGGLFINVKFIRGEDDHASVQKK